MKDYMKVKITKIACKFTVKVAKAEKIFWELSKEGNAFSHVHAFMSMLQLSLFDIGCIYQDFTLCLRVKPKPYYRDAGCKI